MLPVARMVSILDCNTIMRRMKQAIMLWVAKNSKICRAICPAHSNTRVRWMALKCLFVDIISAIRLVLLASRLGAAVKL